MKLPLMGRSRVEQILGLKDQAIADRDQQIAELKAERARLHDVVYKQNFGVQIFDSLPTEAPVPQEEEKPSDEFQEAQERLQAQVTSMGRTRPSMVGSLMSRGLARLDAISARRAHGIPQAAQAALDRAKAEAQEA